MDKKQFDHIVDSLEANISTFHALLSGLDTKLIKWRIDDDRWCLQEIVCHLLDEEREDFRLRCKITLEQPGEEPPRIDPEEWVTSRKYMEKDYANTLQLFLDERRDSVEWLRSLQDPNWSNGFKHRIYGMMTASMFLTNWLGHDLLHIRQIIRTRFAWLQMTTDEDLRYAGEWTD